MEVEVIGMGVEEEGSSTPNGRFYYFFGSHVKYTILKLKVYDPNNLR